MDPQACLDLVQAHLDLAQTEPPALQEAEEALENYREWVSNGGFIPRGGTKRYRRLAKKLATIRRMHNERKGTA